MRKFLSKTGKKVGSAVPAPVFLGQTGEKIGQDTTEKRGDSSGAGLAL